MKIWLKIALSAVRLPKFEPVNGKSWSSRKMMIARQPWRHCVTGLRSAHWLASSLKLVARCPVSCCWPSCYRWVELSCRVSAMHLFIVFFTYLVVITTGFYFHNHEAESWILWLIGNNRRPFRIVYTSQVVIIALWCVFDFTWWYIRYSLKRGSRYGL